MYVRLTFILFINNFLNIAVTLICWYMWPRSHFLFFRILQLTQGRNPHRKPFPSSSFPWLISLSVTDFCPFTLYFHPNHANLSCMLLCFSYHQSNLQLIYRHIASSLEKQHLIFNALFTLKCHSKWLCEPTLLIPLRQGPKWHRMLSGCSCQVNIFSCLDAFFLPAALKLRLKPAVLVLHCVMHVSLCPHICLPVYPLFPCIELHNSILSDTALPICGSTFK